LVKTFLGLIGQDWEAKGEIFQLTKETRNTNSVNLVNGFFGEGTGFYLGEGNNWVPFTELLWPLEYSGPRKAF